MNQTIEITTCSDCGGKFDEATMYWGCNNWNNNEFTDEEYAYVCKDCWNNRSKLI